MLRGRSRDFAKRLLFKSRVKLVYDRITHTRFTTLYFFFALLSCLVLCALQAVLHYDNTAAVNILGNVVHTAGVPAHITMVADGHIWVCDRIPDHHDECEIVLDLSGTTQPVASEVGRPLDRRDHDHDDEYGGQEDYDMDDDSEYDDDEASPTSTKYHAPQSGSISLNSSTSSPYPLSCIYSLSWLEESLRDSQREDVTTIFFEVWLFTLGLVAILNESLPHLGAAFFGHVLGGAWSISRVQSTRTLVSLYRKSVVPGACEATDFLGTWWELRLVHTIPVVATNGVSIIALGLLSWKLFGVYSKQTLSRVGASPIIHNIYKLVLFFSVGLQLASFFILASTAIWALKLRGGNLGVFSKHDTLYVAAFIVVFVMSVPWLILGWICVRHECRKRFWIFIVISALLVGISSAMFSSSLYRCIFMTWQFFATVTVTAFIFLVVTAVLGIACYFNYGKGLAHYLHVTEALAGEDFTPVCFPRKSDSKPSQIARQYTSDSFGDVEKTGELAPIPPAVTHSSAPSSFPKLSAKAKATTTKSNFTSNIQSQPIPRPRPTLASAMARGKRGDSVYSDNFDSPMILSSSPPLISDLASPSPLTAKRMIRSHTNALRKSQGPSVHTPIVNGTGNSASGDGEGKRDNGKVDVKTLVSIQKPSPALSITTTISGASMRQTPEASPSEGSRDSGRSRALSMRGKTPSPVERMSGELPSVPMKF